MENCLKQPPIPEEEWLRIVIDNFPLPTFWKNIHSCYLGCNQSFLDYEGFKSRNEVIGKYDLQMPWKAYADQYRQSDKRILDSKQAEFGYEEHQIRSDGTKSWYKTSKIPLLNKSGKPIGILCCFQDVSDQKAAESALKASESKFRSLIETTGTGYMVLDALGCVLDANSEYVRLSGYRNKADIIGRTPMEWTAKCLDHEDGNPIGEFLSSDARFKNFETEYQQTTRLTMPIEINAAKIETHQGKQILALCRDISERKRTEKLLHDKDHLLAGVLNDLLSYVGILETNGQINFINNTPLQISGLKLSDVNGTYFYDSPWWSYSETARNTIKNQLEKCAAGHSIYIKIEAMMGSRGLRWVSFSAHPVFDKKGKVTQLIVEGRDINDDVVEIKQAQSQLFEEKERLQVTLHSIGDAVITTDTSGMIDFMNPVAENLTDWTLKEARGLPLRQVFTIISEDDRQPCADPVSQCLEHGKVVSLGNHTALISRFGKEYSIQDSAAPIRDRDDNLLGVVLVFADITESRKLTKQLAFHASHDPLTELVNRREFEMRLRRSLEAAHEQGQQHALCYMDLDQFKIVNDSCGHVAGDELLREIAGLLNETIRSRDTLARLGGDEFGILMEHCELEQAKTIAEKVRKVVSDFRFSWQSQIFSIGASIGVVAINNTEKSSANLLRDADAACYAAKSAGRNRVHIYQEDDAELANQRSEIQWLSRIHQALEYDQFCLHYQAIQSLKESNGVRYELLLRMKDGEGNLIVPEVFMPAAERYAITGKIDRWVLQTAFNWLKNHPGHIQELDHCAINLSGHSLGDEVFLKFLTDLFEKTGVPPEKICLEITETAAIANFPVAQQFIKTIKAIDCSFALDDFGIGLSSFAYLKNLDVDFLKIDGSFVKNVVTDSNDYAIVKSINEIGHTMGKQTIAEFAENDQILECLTAIGVDFAQGYAIDLPCTLQEIGSFTAG